MPMSYTSCRVIEVVGGVQYHHAGYYQSAHKVFETSVLAIVWVKCVSNERITHDSGALGVNW